MIERQAWLEIAKAWERPVLCTEGEFKGRYAAVFRGVRKGGLCRCISMLFNLGEITDQVSSSMQNRIPSTEGKGLDGIYCWPNTKKGAAARAAFCRRMAAKCEKEK